VGSFAQRAGVDEYGRLRQQLARLHAYQSNVFDKKKSTKNLEES